MVAAAQQTVLRFRGAWSSGQAYDADDIAVTGRWSFRALAGHVAGTQSQPGIGAHWTQFWEPIEGFGTVVRIAVEPPAVAPPQALRIAHAYDAAGTPVTQALPAPAGVTTQQPAAVSLQSAPPAKDLPAVMPAASEIHNDSDAPFPNVSLCLSWLTAMAHQSARREELDDGLQHIERELIRHIKRLEASLVATPADTLTPLAAEALRRKAIVLGVETPGEVRHAEARMVRSMVRLLRKRDRGEGLTAQEAAMQSILDSLDAALEEIDGAVDAIAQDPPLDVTSDDHWPKLTASPRGAP